MNLEETIITVYLRVEEKYHDITGCYKLRGRGFAPALTDVEVLTMEIIGEMQGRHNDAAIWRYFHDHWQSWFPNLGSYKNFAKHMANLGGVKQQIMTALFPPDAAIHIIDGVAMPVCHNARAYRSSVLRGIAAWGFCASKDETYYGLRGHPVINLKGFIVDFIVTPANADERDAMSDIVNKIRGILLGDKGFISKEWKDEMRTHGIDLQTPLRKNMVDTRSKDEVQTILRKRRLIETAIGLLSEQFGLIGIKARDLWHYASKLYRKLLAYNFYVELRES
jgi:hypothetical protein